MNENVEVVVRVCDCVVLDVASLDDGEEEENEDDGGVEERMEVVFDVCVALVVLYDIEQGEIMKKVMEVIGDNYTCLLLNVELARVELVKLVEMELELDCD